MRNIEKVICSIVENEKMRLHFISQLDSMPEFYIKELIVDARCSMEKKNEFFNLLAKNNDYYSLYADLTEKVLKEFYSGLKEDVTVLGYKIEDYTKPWVTIVGFESTIAAQRYIKENYGDSEDMWFEVKVKKPDGGEKRYILNYKGELWYAKDAEFVLSGTLSPMEENETALSTVPYDVGDIVYIDMSPFKKPICGIIIEKKDGWIRYLYAYGFAYIGMQHLRTLGHYRLKKVDCAELSDDDAPLAFLNSVINEDTRNVRELTELIVAQNGCSFETITDMFGEKEVIGTRDWSNRVKWLRPATFDFYKFIESEDIREHLKKINYEMNEKECAYAISASERSLKEKHEAYCELIKNTSDKKLNKTLKRRIEIEKILLDVFYQKDNAVYRYKRFIDGNWDCSDEVFESVQACFNWAGRNKIVVEKRWIQDGESDIRFILVSFDDEKQPVCIKEMGMLDEKKSEIYYCDYFREVPSTMPCPFKVGDILYNEKDGVFVYYQMEKWKSGSWIYAYGNHDVSVSYFLVSDWLDVQYYRKSLYDGDRILKSMSSLLKGTVKLPDFLKACEALKNEERAKSVISRILDNSDGRALHNLGLKE